MNLVTRLRNFAGERDWIMMILSVVGVVGLGVLIGEQYLQPDKRVLAVAAALVLFGITWRLDIVSGLGVLLLALPFPRGTVFGSTNLAFVLLLLIVWLLRYTQREAPGPQRTPFDAPIAGLIAAYAISFYNVVDYPHAFTMTFLFLACLMMFYLIVLNVRTESDLRRLHGFQTAAMCVIYAFCFWELLFPGHALISGWIDLRDFGSSQAVALDRYRVGGPWVDFELLSEFCALNVVFLLFQIVQTRSMTRRALFSVLLLASMVIEFATVTRGGITSLTAGILYLLWLVRRRLNIVPLTIIGGVSVMVIGVITATLHQFTHAGDLFARLGETHLVNGLPDSRAEVWPQALQRMLQHPWIGHGPFYDVAHGLTLLFWPHDLPLFIGNCFGLFGLSMFVWLMASFWRQARPMTDRLDDPSYARAFILVARVQLVIFFVDELKIEYLRNQVYQFQPWILFASMAAAVMMVRRAPQPEAAVPAPVRRLASALARS